MRPYGPPLGGCRTGERRVRSPCERRKRACSGKEGRRRDDKTLGRTSCLLPHRRAPMRVSPERRYDLLTLGETLMRLSPPAQQRLDQARIFDIGVGGSELNVGRSEERRVG